MGQRLLGSLGGGKQAMMGRDLAKFREEVNGSQHHHQIKIIVQVRQVSFGNMI